MPFEIIGEIREIAIFVAGNSIRDLARLRKTYGAGRWRKLCVFAAVESGSPNCTGMKRMV